MFATGERRSSSRPAQEQQQQQFSASKSFTGVPTSGEVASGGSASATASQASGAAGSHSGGSQRAGTVVRRATPILFVTNRGLHLRVPKAATLARADTSICSGSAYDINFCDLERWSTNRANTVSLEDTFTVLQQQQPQQPQPPADAGQHALSLNGSSASGIGYIPVHKRSTVHFSQRGNSTSFTRYDDAAVVE